MDVAVVYDKFSRPRTGGAQTSLHTLLDGLARHRQLSVDVFETEPTSSVDTEFEYTSYARSPIRTPTFTVLDRILLRRQFREQLRDSVTRSSYDLVVAQGDLAPLAGEVAGKAGVPSILFSRSTGANSLEYYDPDDSLVGNFVRVGWGKRAQFPFVLQNVRDYRTGYHAAAAVLANSEYTAGVLERGYDVDPEVVYPPIDLEAYRTDRDPDGAITIVNPRSRAKGLDCFLEVARRRPSDEFLVVGTVPSEDDAARIRELSNVRRLDWCEDMREAYGQTKLLMVPSRVNETFGRVAAEAMVSGIPCVVSDRGALPEVVGETGVVVSDVDDPARWSEAIDRALAQHRPDAQRERVRRFSTNRQIERFVDVIDTVTA